MVDCGASEDDESVYCDVTRAAARGFQLMHVLLHELGHHHDLMQTRRKLFAPSGEEFAEDFANELADDLWPAYFREFAARQ